MATGKIFRSRISIPKFLSRMVLFLMGWRIQSVPLEESKYVMIGVPHTSNWDFLIGYLIMTAIGLKLTWIGKHTLFKKPFGWFLQRTGGIPVDRSIRTNFVDQVVDSFNSVAQQIITIAPEGTRSKGNGWRTGFYYIALGAGVPVILGFLDYRKKLGGIGSVVNLSRDIEKDMGEIRAFYRNISAKYPEKVSEMKFKESK